MPAHQIQRHCTLCERDEVHGQWWWLGNYHGLTGRFCPKCYNKVAHDSYGRPTNPAEYVEAVGTLDKRNALNKIGR